MQRSIESVYNGRVELEYFSDDISTHYILAGERFHHDNELLKLIAKYGGACVEDTAAHALSVNCDFNCMACQHSISHIVRTQAKFFQSRCIEACKRTPKVNDEWEVSLVSYEGIMPKYQDFYCHCKAPIPDKTIIEIMYEIMHAKYPKFYEQSKYCYIKIRRFDLEKPLDVSMVGNQYFQGFLDGKKMEEIHVSPNYDV